ncbi:formate/nitrite transporter family protein [Algoriphagus algorifonticola]|uniref:formate/nitrite transporter family protein n=1 Tax=Algoriphagus algorifonticola TaxID=2593007 RepID=UPI0011A4CEBC|nr:formate/nitrite transporter family protein [Algoriphagus algorifonticola]
MIWKKEKSPEQQEKERQREIDKEIHNSAEEKKDGTKTHGEVLRDQITDALKTYDKNSSSILLSSLTAGMEIGFSYLLLATLFYFLEGKMAEDSIFKMIALVYPMGFILVVLGQSILFTEQTALLTLPVLNKKRTPLSMLKLWGLVISGNLVGGYFIGLLLVWLGPRLEIFDLHVIETIALHVLKAEIHVIFVSAMVAGWLMGLLSWLLASVRDTVSQIVIIFLITSVLSFASLHHSIIGNIEVFTGMISSEQIHLMDYLSFQSTALVGNAFGGAIFVALLKYRAFVFNIGK